MRFSPVDTICRASLDAMEKAATQMVLPHFPPVLELPKTFAVQYDHRASAKFDRMAVINTVVSGIKQVRDTVECAKQQCSPVSCKW